jgi:hypothetical protein
MHELVNISSALQRRQGFSSHPGSRDGEYAGHDKRLHDAWQS